jgi:signal transduction histidine kinase
MSSGTVEPRLNRRTVTMDDRKVVKEVVQESTLQPITPTRSEQIYVPTPQAEPKPQGYAALTAQHIQNSASIPEPTFQAPKQEQPYQPRVEQSNLKPLLPTQAPVIAPAGCTVLVINASQSMAHEITLELSRTLPGSTILFAPTLSLALWILKRRQINLILSSAILPDGALGTLHQFIELMSPPPELVVISDLHSTRAELGSHPGYRFVELRRVSTRQGEERQVIQSRISELGANIRNDLNNPLQEIVAMAFVAHSSQGLSPMAEEALSAIQRAAGNMADVVNMLEDKIRVVVSESSAA